MAQPTKDQEKPPSSPTPVKVPLTPDMEYALLALARVLGAIAKETVRKREAQRAQLS